MSVHEVIAGRYRLLERIGTGGMGVVWRAYDGRLGRDVAVKRLHTRWGVGEAEGEAANLRALREARITARLHHPHAVPVFDVVEHEGQPCLVMQYFPSHSLAELLVSSTLSVPEVARIGGEVAAALAAAHDAGIVHRDVKPANVLVAADGTAKISDFGISHALGDVSLTSTGMVTGTAAYLAPEVARGRPSTPASDVFSLGSTLYTALEGQPPFGSHENSLALLRRVASGQVRQPRRTVSLTPLMLEMLAPEPAARPSMHEVARRLREPLEDVDEVAGPPVAHRATPPAAPWPAQDGPAAAPAQTAGPSAADLVWSFQEPPTGSGPASDEDAVRRRRRFAVAAVALLATVVAGVLGLEAVRDDGTTVASPQRSVPVRPGTPTSDGPSRTAPPSRSVTSGAPTASPTAVPPARTPTRTPPATTTPAPAGSAPTAAELRTAVRDYYALVPGDLDAGWARLTARYQRSTAGSRSTYGSFWGAIDAVRVSEVTATPPGSVTATLTYDYADGRTFVERTSYRLVEDDGILKVDRSTVLSSRQG